MMTFGLTGGIASGKSTASKYFIEHGIPMVDADQVARKIVEPGTPGLAIIVENFGADFLQKDGKLDRKKLGALIFSNKEKRHLLNVSLFPYLKTESETQVQQYHDSGYEIVGYDAALLVEMNLHFVYKPLVVVYCEANIQLKRLMERNSISQEEAERIISTQISTQKRLEVADFVIDSSGSKDETRRQTLVVIQELKKIHESGQI